MTPDVVLSVAGTDSGGAAGLAADLTTFAALGAHGACAVTAVTAQDTTGVRNVHVLPPAVIEDQLDAVLEDLPVAAVKTGMLGSADTVRLVARVVRLRAAHASRSGGRLEVVVDPVLRATSGAALADADVVAAYREHLLPVATVVTPNAAEAAVLLGFDGPPDKLAEALLELCPAVVLTGGPTWSQDGRTETTRGECTDWVAQRGLDGLDHRITPLTHPAVPTDNDHGTGCTFSAALAVHLARGADLVTATRDAATFTTSRLAASRHWDLGRGRGPIAHTSDHDKLDHQEKK